MDDMLKIVLDDLTESYVNALGAIQACDSVLANPFMDVACKEFAQKQKLEFRLVIADLQYLYETTLGT